ncbi:MAG TPA: AMP-binding protein [Bryobacteraceae bacterium]|jgi:phenylacetate-CoA ligase|nr:AMP-binding protein [Bryobacteraceae bacterium]
MKTLLDQILPANKFYARKLDKTSLTELFTTKQELIDDQAQNPPYGTNLTFPLDRYTRFCQTSGTSGHPLLWLDTNESWNWMLGNWDRVYQAANVTPKDHIFFAFSFGPFLGFWTAFEAATRMGALAIPGGGMRSSLRLRTILDTRATVLCCTPTYAIRLAEAAVEEKLDLETSNVRRIIVAGEPGGSIPSTRAHIEKLWPGAKVIDHHGMTETGPVSYGCPERPGTLHVIESSYIAEVIDNELILTNLGRLGSPLIRYRTGDLVKAVRGTCACGSTDLALEGGILGRTDDMVVVRGVNIYPTAIEEVLRSEGVTEYRVEVRTERALTELSIQVESPIPTHHLEAALTNAFSLRIPVSTVPDGSLPRYEAKSKRWIRL